MPRRFTLGQAHIGISFKRTFFISASLAVSLGTIYFYKHLGENVKQYNHAYENIPNLIKDRKFRHKIEGPDGTQLRKIVKTNNDDDDDADFHHKAPISKSNETITIIDASNPDEAIASLIPLFEKRDGITLKSVLGKLSREDWPEFIGEDNNKDEEEYFVSVGVRRAFGASSFIAKLGFTHAVVLVEKRSKKDTKKKDFAIYGYNAGKLAKTQNYFMLNDMRKDNTNVSRYFTFYSELTLNFKEQKELVNFFNRVEELSNRPYRVFSCNCFSAPFMAAIETAEKFAHHHNSKVVVPDFYEESLCLVVPTEQNFSFGVTTNPDIKPFVDLAGQTVNLATKRNLLQKARALSEKVENK